MKVAVLFSGGKDSVFATFWALFHGFDPILVTIKPPEYSMMFHHPNVDKTNLQAKSICLKQVFVKTSEENWRNQLIKTFKKLKIEGIVAGAIESEYQRRRIDEIGEILNIPTYAPLWHKKDELLNEMLEYFEVSITAVSAEGLDEKFLGAPFSKIQESKVPNIHPFLEGGEGETFVTNAPFFKKKIKIKKWKKSFDGQRGVAKILLASI